MVLYDGRMVDDDRNSTVRPQASKVSQIDSLIEARAGN